MAIDYGPPDGAFQSELDQIAVDAVRAGTALAEANRLPDDFPAETLSELCRALAGLKDGTGRNAGVQLEIARAMLPRIRREHFFPEDQIDQSDEDDVRLVRGMSLDQDIGTLITSVTTALDEYRHQLQIEHDDRVGVEKEGQLAEGESISSLNSASSEIIDDAAELEKSLEEHGIGETLKGDILRRRIKDGANLAETARAQLRMRPIVSRWLRASVRALRATPRLIQNAGKAIKIGVDVAKPFGEWWLETQRDVLAGLVKKVNSFADALEEAGKRLAKHTEVGQAQAQRQRNPAVVAAEAQVRQMLLNGRTPPPNLAVLVEIMDLRGKKKAWNRIARPEDLAHLVNLEELRAFYTDLTIDQVIGPLSKLSRLRNLQIYDGKNLHQIGKLTGLTSLSVQTSLATDFSALGKLTGLTSLTVGANQVTDISALDKLTGLTSLSVEANQATDISALGKLTGLISLVVHVSQATDISALGKLIRLTSLSVQSNQATDISALGKLTGLTSLNFQFNQATDISALGKLTGLTSLSVEANQATDISALGKLTGLTSLNVQSNQVTDISALGKLTGLTRLMIQMQRLAGVSALSSLPILYELTLVDIHKSIDLKPLANLKTLRTIKLASVDVINLDALKGVEVIRS